MKHHEAAIDTFVARSSDDPEILGIIVTGSVARGLERADSDVDLYLVVTEERWDRAVADNRIIYVEDDDSYQGGYFDVKVVTLAYIDDAGERGDDPVRDSFARTRIVFSRVPDLAERVERAATVPPERWVPLAESFLAQARLHGDYFLPHAYDHGDLVLLHHAAVHTAVSASRALLALNHVAFQGPKYLTAAVAALEHKPDGWDALIRDLLAEPTTASAKAVIVALESFRDWGISFDDSLSTFVHDNELAWRTRLPTPEYS
jgi:predicted nucleotidyltransferase